MEVWRGKGALGPSGSPVPEAALKGVEAFFEEDWEDCKATVETAKAVWLDRSRVSPFSRLKADFGVNVGEPELAGDRRQFDDLLWAIGFREQPLVVGLPGVIFNMHLLLRDQKIFLEGFYSAIVFGILAPVVSLGGIGKHLDQKAGIQEYILAVVFEKQLSAAG